MLVLGVSLFRFTGLSCTGASASYPEEVVLDQNTITHDIGINCDYLLLGQMKVSSDQRLLAFTLDTTGAESYTLYFRDLITQRVLPDVVPNVVSVVFADGDGGAAVAEGRSRTIFYTQADR